VCPPPGNGRRQYPRLIRVGRLLQDPETGLPLLCDLVHHAGTRRRLAELLPAAIRERLHPAGR
jgi:hypothetical protein